MWACVRVHECANMCIRIQTYACIRVYACMSITFGSSCVVQSEVADLFLQRDGEVQLFHRISEFHSHYGFTGTPDGIHWRS